MNFCECIYLHKHIAWIYLTGAIEKYYGSVNPINWKGNPRGCGIAKPHSYKEVFLDSLSWDKQK